MEKARLKHRSARRDSVPHEDQASAWSRVMPTQRAPVVVDRTNDFPVYRAGYQKEHENDCDDAAITPVAIVSAISISISVYPAALLDITLNLVG